MGLIDLNETGQVGGGTQAHILQAIWGPADTEDSRYLHVYIRQLRAKIDDAASDPRYIFTEPGVGYRFRET